MSKEKQNVLERVGGVLFAPVETFQDIARRPDVLWPLLLILAIGYTCTALVMPRLDISAVSAANTEQMRKQRPDLGPEQIADIERATKTTATVSAWTGPLLGAIGYAILSGVLLLAFRMVGGEGSYKQAFSTTLYAWMPRILLTVITTIVVIARGTFDPTTAATLVKSNLAFLGDRKEPVLFSLLASFDVFTIWTLALLSAGFAAISRVSKAKAAAMVVSLWLVLVFIKAGLAALGAWQMK